MTEREALKLALEALEFMSHVDSIFANEFDFQINAIKEALAQPEPCCYEGIAHDCHAGEGCRIAERMKAAQKPPQRLPLSDEEILTYRHMIDWTAEWSYVNFARAIEAAHGIKGEA